MINSPSSLVASPLTMHPTYLNMVSDTVDCCSTLADSKMPTLALATPCLKRGSLNSLRV